MAKTLLDVLEDKFLIDDGCWQWTAFTSRTGYGQMRYAGRIQYAHRVVYELLVGPIPEGLQLDHLCRNRACVRPDHLEPVTCRENVLRGVGPAAKNKAKSHCLNGHEFTSENTYTDVRGNRSCRTCGHVREARWRCVNQRRRQG